jgi:uncharacterized protein (DUF1330 family)
MAEYRASPAFGFGGHTDVVAFRRGAAGAHVQQRIKVMAKKGYWVSAYRSIKDPDKVAAYAKLAGPALNKYGARYLARDVAAQAYEAGIKARIVIVEFDSVAQAVAAHDSPEYQAALKVFDNAAERDFRIVEGLE